MNQQILAGLCPGLYGAGPIATPSSMGCLSADMVTGMHSSVGPFSYCDLDERLDLADAAYDDLDFDQLVSLAAECSARAASKKKLGEVADIIEDPRTEELAGWGVLRALRSKLISQRVFSTRNRSSKKQEELRETPVHPEQQKKFLEHRFFKIHEAYQASHIDDASTLPYTDASTLPGGRGTQVGPGMRITCARDEESQQPPPFSEWA